MNDIKYKLDTVGVKTMENFGHNPAPFVLPHVWFEITCDLGEFVAVRNEDGEWELYAATLADVWLVDVWPTLEMARQRAEFLKESGYLEV